MGERIKFITDVIGEEYKQWGSSDIILITAPTGTGKTTFILQTYLKWIIKRKIDLEQRKIIYAYPMRMLYLVNRSILKKQLEEELKRISINLYSEFNGRIINLQEFITIETYQSIEKRLLNHKSKDLIELLEELNRYDCVVCDEAHYFYADSNFNTNTEISFDCIRNVFDDKIQIYISATMKNVKSIIQTRIPVYTPYCKKKPVWGKNRFKEYSANGIYNIALQTPLKSLDELIEIIFEHQKEKWLIFVDSIEEGKNFQKQLNEKFIEKTEITKEDIVFIDARYEQDETASNSVRQIIENRYSKKKIIITTAVMDNGISLHDENLRNIVILTDTEEEFIQMLGRKRTDSSLLKVYIVKRSQEYFQKRLNYQELIYKNYQKIENYVKAIYKRYFNIGELDASGDSEYLIRYSLERLSVEDKEKGLGFLDAQTFLKENPEFMGNIAYEKNTLTECIVTPFLDLIYRSQPYIFFVNDIKKSYKNCMDYETIMLNQQAILNRLLSNDYGSFGLKRVLYSVRGLLAVNTFALHRCLSLINFYQDMIQRLEIDDFAFVVEQASWIGQGSKIEQIKKDEYEKNKMAIIDCITPLLDQSLSLEKNEWCFKHQIPDEMIYFLKKCKAPLKAIEYINKRNPHREEEKYEDWRQRIKRPITFKEDYVNMVLAEIGFEYRIKKKGKDFFVFIRDTDINK